MKNFDNDWLPSRQMEIPGVSSSVQPDQPQPLAVFNDRMYTVILDSGSLSLAWTSDGEAWVDAYANLENIHTGCSPSLAVFDGKLYCAWNAGLEEGIKYAVYDGGKWHPSQRIANTGNWNNAQSPSLAADNNSLYCACLEPGKNQYIHLLWTNDGKTWIEKKEAVLRGIGTKLAPSIACFNNKVYCAWNGYHNESVFYSSFDGKIWSKQSKLEGLETHGLAYPPVLQNINQKLYCARTRSCRSINEVGIVILQSGENWQTQPKLNLSHEISGLALAGLKKRLICTWVDSKSKTTNLSFTFSDELHFSENIFYPTSETQDKCVGPCLVNFNELLYCAWAERGKKFSSIQLIYSSDGLKWEKTGALNSIKITGVPSLTVYNGELCCAWNDTNGISFSTFSGKTWSSPQNIKTEKKIIRNQSPVLVVYESKLFCIWTNSDSRISFASRWEDTEWNYYDLLDIKPVKTTLQPSAAVFGNLLYFIWNQENNSINASYFSLPNHVSTVQQITGPQVFDRNNSCIRSEPPVLICTNNRMYCGYKAVINEKPYLNILCSLNGLEWKTECFIPLLKENASTQNNDTMAFRGSPSMTSFRDKLYCAWNSYEENSIVFSSATISEPWAVKYISTPDPGGLQVNDFVNFPENSTPGNVGVCLSGGGSRAAIAAMGEIRGLKYLTTSDGKSLLEQVKALSTVSGGTWFGGAFSYLNDPVVSDDDFLNKYVEDRSKYVVTDPTNTLPENLVLDKLHEGNFGNCISSDFAYFPNLIASIFQMYQQNATPLGSTYQTFVGQLILERFGLYSGGDTEPNSTFSYNEQTKNDLLERNPGLANKTIHLYPVPEAGKRLRRPFWISNFSMLTNSVAPDHPVRQVIPVQSTPFYTGVFSSPQGVVDNNKQSIGGGGVETFAFNSVLSSFKQNTDNVYQHRLFSIADSIGVSSSFYAYLLMGKNQFSPISPMLKDSQGWENTVGGILGMVDQLNLEDIFQSIIALSNKKTVKAGSSIPAEHNLDELAAMAVDMMNITGLTEKLNTLGVKDINEMITAAFNYFQVKFPNLNLMDGLMDAGVASFILLLITSLIDKVTQVDKDISSSVINSFNKFFKSFPLLQLIGKDIKKFDTIVKEIDTIIKDFKIISKYIDAATNEVVPMLHELVPRYYYWSEHNAESQQNWAFQPDEFCDGGILENYGIANMLTYTDIDNIICFINSSPIILNAGYFDPQIEGDTIITGIEIDAGIPPLFAYHPYNAEIRGYVQYKEGDTSDILSKNNQVFPKSKFYEVLTGLIKASGRNCRQKSTNFKQPLTTVDNALFGVKGGRRVNVLWSYLNYAQDWVDGLNKEVQNQVRNIKDFPNYTICFMQYNNREINLMSGQAAWNVAGKNNKNLFISMFE